MSDEKHLKRTQSGTSINTSDLPPERKGRNTAKVSAPLAHTRLTSIIYVLALMAVLLLAFYAYRITQWKAQAGGWWNLALGRYPASSSGDRSHHRSHGFGSSKGMKGVEGKIVDLADVLGIQPTELASAIKPLIPPAKASSIAKSKETGKSGVMGVLAGSNEGSNSGGSGGLGLENVVGMDEPVDLD
jgi:hypothetical protein